MGETQRCSVLEASRVGLEPWRLDAQAEELPGLPREAFAHMGEKLVDFSPEPNMSPPASSASLLKKRTGCSCGCSLGRAHLETYLG